MIAMQGATLVYREDPLPLWLRGFAAVLGVGLMIGIPGPFPIHADLTRLMPDLLLAVPFILAPLALGGFFVFLSLCSARELWLDPSSRMATDRLRGPLVNKTRHIPLSDFSPPHVFLRESSEEGPSPILRLRLPNRRIDMVCFDSLAEAEQWAVRIRAILGGQG